MKEIIQNYNSILEQIRIAADEANRDMNEIKLIVVTKKFEAENIKPLLLKRKDSRKCSQLRTICRTPGSQKIPWFLDISKPNTLNKWVLPK